MFKKMLGLMALVIGGMILAWIGYNYFVEMQPEAEGRNPLVPVLFSVCLLGYGFISLFSKRATGKS